MERISPKELYALTQTATAKLEQEASRPEPDLRRLLLSMSVIESLADKLGSYPMME